LTSDWAGTGVRVVTIDAYYDDKAQIKRLLAEGQSLDAIGQHASIIDSSELMSIEPKGVDLSRYRKVSLGMEPTGVAGDPSSANPERGKTLLAMRIEAATFAIKAMLATQ
jgi:creatinine amidohydrolase